LVIDDNKVIKEERLLVEKEWRVRCVRQGPEGYLYLGIDTRGIVRIKPID
jgi:glucose/arabinose dehydrogenase